MPWKESSRKPTPEVERRRGVSWYEVGEGTVRRVGREGQLSRKWKVVKMKNIDMETSRARPWWIRKGF
jgi:hypothetical protein